MPMVFSMWRRRTGTVAETGDATSPEPAPGDFSSADFASADLAPDELTSAEPAPGESAPVESAPGEPVPGESVPGESVPGESVPVQFTAGHEPGDAPPAGPHRAVVRALLALFLIVGLASAAVAGTQSKNAAARQARQTFDQTASGIAANVAKALQRDADLTTATRAVVEQNPGMSNTQLASWFTALTPTGLSDVTGVVSIQKLTPTQYYYFRAGDRL